MLDLISKAFKEYKNLRINNGNFHTIEQFISYEEGIAKKEDVKMLFNVNCDDYLGYFKVHPDRYFVCLINCLVYDSHFKKNGSVLIDGQGFRISFKDPFYDGGFKSKYSLGVYE